MPLMRSMRSKARSETLHDELSKLLNSASDAPNTDGALVLPMDASVEPGTLLYKIHRAWTRQAGDSQSRRTFKKLNEYSRQRIPSLQHKLKGRISISAEETETLLRAFLGNWGQEGDANNGQHPVLAETGFDLDQAAEAIRAFMFGPIYGVSRVEVRIVPSPGINTATFMREKVTDRSVLLLPITDRAMWGENPVTMLYGTRLSLAYAFQRTNPQDCPYIIYAIRPESCDESKDYVKYVYHRSLLATLFQLLKIGAEGGWALHDTGTVQLRFPDWNVLQRRLWVCIAPPNLRVVDTIPDRVPADWDELDGLSSKRLSFDEFGFVVVTSEKDARIDQRYYRYLKSNGAFSRIDDRLIRPTMREAHKKIVYAVLSRGNQQDPDGDSRNGLLSLETPDRNGSGPHGWKIISAQEFLHGEDLNQQQWESRP